MSATHLAGAILALDKHKAVGIVGFIVGGILLVIAVLRTLKRTAGSMIMAFTGIVVLLLAILLYLRKI